MSAKTTTLIILGAVNVMASPPVSAKPPAGHPWFDGHIPFRERITLLLSEMTLEEKVSQLVNDSPPIERLGIPRYNWWSECLHGVARNGRATVFPQCIALAATFDDELVQRVTTAISDEARAKHNKSGATGRYQGLSFWSPNINIFRDPRWGRGHETFGEDPYLTSRMGLAYVRGIQGDHPKYLKAAACAKHYAVHSGPEPERHRFDARVSVKDLNETYLPAFESLVRGGVASVMGAYNRVNGQAACAHDLLMRRLDEWGFDGYFVSDCDAINDIHKYHRLAGNVEAASAMALAAGCDLCCGREYTSLVDAYNNGLIDMDAIDTALSHLLRVRMRLGLFDDPESNPYTRIPYDVVNCDRHVDLARRAARECIVLLKNDGILPLQPGKYKSIGLNGFNAENVLSMLGNYHGISPNIVTVAEGLAARIPEGIAYQYRRGALLDRKTPNPHAWWAGGDLLIEVLGLDPTCENESGDALTSAAGGDRTAIELPPSQAEFLRKQLKGDKPMVLILMGGSPVALPEDILERANAVLFCLYPGEQGGTAIAEVLFGDYSPAGRLPITFPKSTKQLPPFEDYAMEGRTYRYLREDPQFPFGFGLSYTTFAYADLKTDKDNIKPGESLTVSVRVTNQGTFAADEVVQVYVRHRGRQTRTPNASLVGFQRIHLKKKESRLVRFTIAGPDLMYVNERGEPTLEPGVFEIIAGQASPGKRSKELGASCVAKTVRVK